MGAQPDPKAMPSRDSANPGEAILRAVNFFAHALINTRSWETVIDEALGRIGMTANVDRAYVYQNDPRNSDQVSLRFEWCASRVRPLLGDPSLAGLSYSRMGFTRWYRELSDGEPISGPVQEFPQSEQAFLSSRHVKSMVIVPVFADDIWWGFLGFNDYEKPRSWRPVEIAALQTAADCLGAAIARANTEATLTELLERYRDFVEDTDSLVAQVDGLGRLRFANRALRRILGNNVIGEFIYKQIDPCDRDAMVAAMTTAIEQLEPNLSIEFGIVSSTGERRDIQWTLNLYYREQRVVAVNAIGRDMTEVRLAENARRHMDENLRQMHKLESLGILAGGVAHDFNNLLTTILGNASFARREYDDGGSPIPMIQRIEQTALRAAELTQQMLDYSGKGSFDAIPICLSKITADMTALLESNISKKADIVMDFPTDIPAIEADPSQIRQVVMNLVLNASEALPEGRGRIAVSTGVRECDQSYLDQAVFAQTNEEGLYVFLRVSDDGAGMSEADRKRMFDPFFTTKFTGRGLGLPVVLGVVRGHGGAVLVESQSGQGTEFTILFPASRRAAVSLDSPVDDHFEEVQGTILVIDDEDSILEVASQILSSAGYRVLTANNGKQGLEAFLDHAPTIDGVLLDFTMPEMDGEETLRALRNIRPDLYVVLSSGYSEKHASRRFQDVTPDAFLQKPYRAGDLIRIVAPRKPANRSQGE